METDELRNLAEDLRGELAWAPGIGWLIWDGKVWDSQFGRDAAADRVNRWREESGHGPLAFRQMRPVLHQLQATLSVEESALDTHPDLLNVQNGVVDLRTGELHPHDSALYLTRVAGVDYAPEATNSAWDRVVAALQVETRNQLGSFVAGAVTGRPTGSAAVVHGPGLSGKSSFFRPLYEALGNHALYAANWPQAGDLRGVRLVVAEDIARINTGRLRPLLTGDLVHTRYPNREAMTFRPSHSLALVMGPQGEQELDEGTRRRLEFISLDPLADPDPSLRPLLKEPGALRAALAWAVHQATSTARDA
jgi:putative DNA primase/helicase